MPQIFYPTANSDNGQHIEDTPTFSVSNVNMYASADPSDTYIHRSFMVFKNITLEKDAIVPECKITMVRGSSYSDPPADHVFSVKIYGAAVDSASGPSSGSSYSTYPKTSAYVEWLDFGTFSAGPSRKSTVDLKSIVQEIVNRPGWVSGNNIMFWFDSADYANAAYCSLNTYLQYSSWAPQLEISDDLSLSVSEDLVQIDSEQIIGSSSVEISSGTNGNIGGDTMRHPFWGIVRGKASPSVIPGVSITVCLNESGEIPATIYDTAISVTPIENSTVITNSSGYFIFWVDDTEYDASTLFKLIFYGDEYEGDVYENIVIIAGSELTRITSNLSIATYAIATDHSSNAIISECIAGESIAFGLPMYLKSDGKWYPAEASTSTKMTAKSISLGITTEESASGYSGNLILFGTMRDDSWNWTPGGDIYVDKTGGLTQASADPDTYFTAGDTVQIIAFALSQTEIFVSPNFNYVTK